MGQVLKKEAGLDRERPKGLEQRRGIRVWAGSIPERGGVCFLVRVPCSLRCTKEPGGGAYNRYANGGVWQWGGGLVERGGAKRHIRREVLLITGQTLARGTSE